MAVSKEVALGIASIDAQHQELVDLFNEFDHCIKTDASQEIVDSIVQRAIACANAHFEHEEDLIARTGYPGADDHKFRHRHMRMEFATLVGDAVAIKAHDPVTLLHLKDMRAILMDHIAGPDRELVAFLKTAGVE